MLLYIAHTDSCVVAILCTNKKQDVLLYLSHTDLYDSSVVAIYTQMINKLCID